MRANACKVKLMNNLNSSSPRQVLGAAHAMLTVLVCVTYSNDSQAFTTLDFPVRT